MKLATGTNCVFPVSGIACVKEKMLNWSQRFNIFCLLDNHQYNTKPHSVECLLAAGAADQFEASSGDALPTLQSFLNRKKSWLFGHIAYDLKNEIEQVSSKAPGHIQFPDVFFFEPSILIKLQGDELFIESRTEDPENIFNAILESERVPVLSTEEIVIRNRVNKEEYLKTIDQLKMHILRGDCYEINFCHEFFSENVSIDPVMVYEKLSKLSPNPFSAFYKVNHDYLLCASPERFIRKEGEKILSQPIKGTSRRELSDPLKDDENRSALFNSSKERSENVMAVDLVRNDLSKVCEEGSVKVDELFGIYSFPQVHQMISTVSGRLKKKIQFSDIIFSTFPMASMTGAPKKRVMDLIEQYEKTRRGIFSGALGYIEPGGDFDFNVVIRSIMYNARNGYLSFMAGSGITWYSDGEKEWDECLLKAEAMKIVLSKDKNEKVPSNSIPGTS